MKNKLVLVPTSRSLASSGENECCPGDHVMVHTAKREENDREVQGSLQTVVEDLMQVGGFKGPFSEEEICDLMLGGWKRCFTGQETVLEGRLY